MNENKINVSLDIGTSKICTIVAQRSLESSQLEILGVGNSLSRGLKKGSVVDIEQTIDSIEKSIQEAELMSGVSIAEVHIGISGSHISCFNNSGVVAIKGKEITDEDIERVFDAAKAVVIPSEKEILHVIPIEFKVDNISKIRDPRGMCGTRLEVFIHVVLGSTPLIQNLVKCVKQANINVLSLTLQPIASSLSVLSEEEKEMGIVLLDIGAGTTDLIVWKDGNILFSKIIPIGGGHFTRDLAVALKVSHREAEAIKLKYGSVLSEQINQSEKIFVQGIHSIKQREIKLNYISKVLGQRAEELMEMVKEILEKEFKEIEISGGFVFVGGGSLTKGLVELGEYIMEKPVKIGTPIISEKGMSDLMKSPKYATALGLLPKEDYVDNEARLNKGDDLVDKVGNSLKTVLKEIF